MTPVVARSGVLALAAALLAVGAGPLATSTGPLAGARGQSPRFADQANGTVVDSRTGLMWASRDNGSDIAWQGAKAYCEHFGAGGHTDWRMPTATELMTLYDERESWTTPCTTRRSVHLTPLIRLSCTWVWSSTEAGPSRARAVHFFDGTVVPNHRVGSWHGRALPVRTAGRAPGASARKAGATERATAAIIPRGDRLRIGRGS